LDLVLLADIPPEVVAALDHRLIFVVVRCSVVFLLGMCVLVYLQSTAVLSWMVP
jgi:hypothetical protein